MSAYVSSQSQLQEPPATVRAKAIMEELKTLPDEALPPVAFMNTIGSHNRDHYVAVAASLFDELVKRGQLSEESAVVDIGCGCGRLAVPLCRFLTRGRYWGIDVWPDGIAWCDANIAATNARASFHCLTAADNYYFNAERSFQDNRFLLPFLEDGSIDLCFSISVFTHLVQADARQYLLEIARTLREDGIFYVTTFIIDEFFWNFRQQTGAHQGVKEVDSGVYQAYAQQDIFVGYAMSAWQRLVRECGLRIISFETGSWAAKPGARVFQDTFILMRDRSRNRP